MAFHPYRRPQGLEQDALLSVVRPLGESFLKCRREGTQKSDKELLDSGYMSDCTVICRDVKWSTHRAILCSRNKWFRLALDGPFKEGSTGIVTIKETDPDAVQAVLDYIYAGEVNQRCSTPAKIVEMWKAGDFFDIRELVVGAEYALTRRIKASQGLLLFTPFPVNRRDRLQEWHIHEPHHIHYIGCGHFETEHRICGVQNVNPRMAFHLCEPRIYIYLEGTCKNCRERYGDVGGSSSSLPAQVDKHEEQYANMHGASSVRSSRSQELHREIPPNDYYSALIEGEIQALCEALLVATIDTPPGSRMQKALIEHMCNTPVLMWGGHTVCKFLEW